MIRTRYRNIPQTMGTQHPDNAAAPYWEKDGDGFISAMEEVSECASSFKDLGCEEYMWDWEGKYVDEAVVEKLLTEQYDFFHKHPLGKERFLTFRIPNIWEEHGRSLARAFMNILTAEEFARDIGINRAPLFEVILPMADRAQKMIKIQQLFSQLARFKHQVFNGSKKSIQYIELIPLIEGVYSMATVRTLLSRYVALHKKEYKRKPEYLRVFLARSDPALVSGMPAAVLGNRIALSELTQWSKEIGIDVYPWLGAGSLPFRGGLRPDRIDYFLKTYPGIQGVSIQSSFRYDYPLDVVKKGIRQLNSRLASTEAIILSSREKKELTQLIGQFEQPYQRTVLSLSSIINTIASAVPARRERRLHIGLLHYGRRVGTQQMPRAIPFTAALYTLGVPPELIGTGRALASCTKEQLQLLEKQYITLSQDLIDAGHYLNKENLAFLAKHNPGFREIQRDVGLIEDYIGESLGPKTSAHYTHRNWTSTAYFQRKKRSALQEAILAAAQVRKSLG